MLYILYTTIQNTTTWETCSCWKVGSINKNDFFMSKFNNTDKELWHLRAENQEAISHCLERFKSILVRFLCSSSKMIFIYVHLGDINTFGIFPLIFKFVIISYLHYCDGLQTSIPTSTSPLCNSNLWELPELSFQNKPEYIGLLIKTLQWFTTDFKLIMVTHKSLNYLLSLHGIIEIWAAFSHNTCCTHSCLFSHLYIDVFQFCPFAV